MRTDFTVNCQCHIVPSHVSADLIICAVVELNAQQGIWLQAPFCGKGIVFCFTLHEGSKRSFLCRVDDLRVVLHQSGIDKFLLYGFRFGFRGRLITNKQRGAGVKAD